MLVLLLLLLLLLSYLCSAQPAPNCTLSYSLQSRSRESVSSTDAPAHTGPNTLTHLYHIYAWNSRGAPHGGAYSYFNNHKKPPTNDKHVILKQAILKLAILKHTILKHTIFKHVILKAWAPSSTRKKEKDWQKPGGPCLILGPWACKTHECMQKSSMTKLTCYNPGR